MLRRVSRSLATLSSAELIKLEDKFSAHNYHPMPVVFHSARGCKVTDPEGREYYDFLSAYSAVNQGHMHPRIVEALKAQLDLLALSSRAFHNDRFGPFCKFMSEYFGYERILPMNTGAEACETAIKVARKWGYLVKGIEPDKALVIACNENFHGRTISMISMSDDPEGHDFYGPHTPGFPRIPYNDIPALEKFLQANGKQVAAFFVEPIQGEAGVKVPDLGYLKKAKALCDHHNVLLIADEVQTGIGRTGKLLCHYYDDVRPDIVCLAKALSGGLYPVSCILADSKIMDVIKPGTHGSTFGGNPIACAVATEALKVVKEERLTERAAEMGELFRKELAPWAKTQSHITDVRGRGLLNAIELNDVTPDKDMAYRLCIKMRDNGLLAKPTHGNIIRFSPPLVISAEQVRECTEIIKKSYLALIPDLTKTSGGHH